MIQNNDLQHKRRHTVARVRDEDEKGKRCDLTRVVLGIRGRPTLRS